MALYSWEPRICIITPMEVLSGKIVCQQILTSTFSLFFPSKYGGNTMWELECEDKLLCDQDQKSFKGISIEMACRD